MYSQKKKSKRHISLFSPPAHTYCTRFPTFTCFKCKSHFFFFFFLFFAAKIFYFSFFLAATSQRKVFNYVQLIRSDGTPPTQAPPSNSGCPSPLLSSVSSDAGGSGPFASI